MPAREFVESAILWAAVAAEAAIFLYVISASIKYMIPWDEMRAKREIRRFLAERVPAHRETVRRLSARVMHHPRRYRAPWACDLADAITRDVIRLLGLCLASIGAIERHMAAWPHEAARIESDVAATLQCVEKLLDLRDLRIPEVVRERVALAAEALAALAKFRDEMAAHIEAHHAAGVSVGYERRVITMLGNAFAAHAGSLKDDPDGTIALLPKWRARIGDVVVTAEIRASVEARVAQVAEGAPARIARVRALVERLSPLVFRLRPASGSESPIRRLVDLMAADAAVGKAQDELGKAVAGVAQEGTDLGTEGDSVRRLKAALICAERAEALLRRFEEDLLMASAAFEAAMAKDDPTRKN